MQKNSHAPSRALSVYFLDARLSISGLLTEIRPISTAGILARCDSAATINRVHIFISLSQTVTAHSRVSWWLLSYGTLITRDIIS